MDDFRRSKCPGCLNLQEEIDRLKLLLKVHGIAWENRRIEKAESSPVNSPISKNADLNLSPAEKVALFQRLFRGRTDVYPVRWKSAKGKSGYSPACGNEWKAGVCGKPRVKCGDCDQRQFLPVTDQVIYDHLAGNHTIGVYPLMNDETCFFLAVDFDEADWREDAQAFMQSCREVNVPAAAAGKSSPPRLTLPLCSPFRAARTLRRCSTGTARSLSMNVITCLPSPSRPF